MQLRIDLNNDDINCSGHHSNASAGNDTYDDIDEGEFRSGSGKQPDASSLRRKKVTASVVTTVGAVRWLLCTVLTDIVPAVNVAVEAAWAATIAVAVTVVVVVVNSVVNGLVTPAVAVVAAAVLATVEAADA